MGVRAQTYLPTPLPRDIYVCQFRTVMNIGLLLLKTCSTGTDVARVGMTDEEITTYLKETFCVDNTYTAKALFNAAELPASWASVSFSADARVSFSADANTYILRRRAPRTYLPTPQAPQPRRAPTYLPTPWP